MAEQFKTFRSIQDAYDLLLELGAPDRLLQHVKLVGEVAEILILQFQKLGLVFDVDWIRLGVAFHDVGKILHSSELVEKGTQHEAAGEMMLLAQGVEPKIARCCRSHGQWSQLDCAFEELVVALADNLWKGKRNNELENQVIGLAATMGGQDYWNVFVDLDSGFEQVAADGDRRLARSMVD
jgi:HD superfamily phosphodiesterase